MTEAERVAETLSEAQKRVLLMMSNGDLVYPISYVAADCEVPVAETRKIIRGFHADSLAEFGPLYDEDEPRVRGSGYWLSRLGIAVRAILSEPRHD